MAINLRNTDYFRGEIVVSLVNSRPAQEQPIGAILQQVSLWEVPEPRVGGTHERAESVRGGAGLALGHF